MKIQIRYKNNRLDIFDTSSFTKPEPFDDANMLTNFEVRVDELGNTGLWLIAHHYEVSEAIAKTADEGETPWQGASAGGGSCWQNRESCRHRVAFHRRANHARKNRRRACRHGAIRADVRAMAVPMRRAEHHAAAVRLFDALCRAFPELSANDAAIARMCGFSKQAMDELRVRVVPGSQETEVDECDWGCLNSSRNQTRKRLRRSS